MDQTPQFNDAFAWNAYDFLFDSILENLLVTEKNPVGAYGQGYYQVFYYSFKDSPIYLSYDAGTEQIIVSSGGDFTGDSSFRELLVEEKSGSSASISLLNFEYHDNKGHGPVPVISLRVAGLGIVDISDTDPVYYQMMSYELNREQKYGNKNIRIKAVEISKGDLVRENTYRGNAQSHTFNAVGFQVYFDTVS